MATFAVILLLGNIAGLISDVDGFRFKYNRRLKPETPRYTPYAYSNYISYSPNKGWPQSSSYVKFVPEVRYTQTYKFYRGYYTTFINMYFSMASSDAYKNRFIPPDALVCANYDANDKGDVMGIFSCPNSWEPKNFTNCCGQDYSEFCCDQKATTSRWVTAIAAIAGVLAAIIIVAVITVCCIRRQKQNRKDDTRAFSTGPLEVHEPPQSAVKEQRPVRIASAKETSPFSYSTVQ